MKPGRAKKIPIKVQAEKRPEAAVESEMDGVPATAEAPGPVGAPRAAAGIEAAFEHEGSPGRVEESPEIEPLKRELSDAIEREKRLTRDFQNHRRHAEAALARAGQEAKEELLSELGEILRDLEQAMSATEQDADAVREGIALVAENVERLLSEHGLERIPTVNAAFDPSIHEAVTTERVAGVARGTVVRELSPGFRTSERVVRPARVSVAG
jgi:molecular chaperone GrpE